MKSIAASRLAGATTQRPCVRTCAAATDVPRNVNFGKLKAGYLFPEIAKRRNAHQEANPDAKIISLGIGDTTEPLTPTIAKAMSDAALAMGTREGYSGYQLEAGRPELRKLIAEKLYPGGHVKPSEVFVSDGSKCDIGRLQMMFGKGLTIAAQDPSYPVYVDTSVIMGNTGDYSDSISGFENLEYMVCRPETNFFPDLSNTGRTDLIFFCSPNNPTGAAASRAQLEELVAFAKKNKSIIIYDAAYALFIEDDDCPKSIFEIAGADEVAIETCSFSKYAGFTGVRLGWTVVPEALRFADGTPVQQDFSRIMSTCFNAASVISQAGGVACLSDEGMKEMMGLISFYKENASILRKTFIDMGFEVHGGTNAPYIWVGFPGQNSWDVFAQILEKCDIVTTPGSGFGPGGEGFVRVSAFCSRENVQIAVERFQKAFAK